MWELKKETSTHYLCDICVETTANQSKQYTITEHDAGCAPAPAPAPATAFQIQERGCAHFNGRPLVEKFLVPAGAGAGRLTLTTTTTTTRQHMPYQLGEGIDYGV